MQNSITSPLPVNGLTTASLFATILFSFALPVSAEEDEAVLTPPSYPTSDMHNVNIAGGTPSVSQTDLSIGSGALSLSHRIATFSGYFQGYADNFANGKVSLSERAYLSGEPNTIRYYMQVRTGSSVYEFAIDPNTQKYGPMRAIMSPDAGQTDPKNTLEDLGSYYLLTLANGTEMRFEKGTDQSVHATARLVNIRRPNGFTIAVERVNGRVQSVNTNNGLQFKYNYITPAQTSWDASYPHSITALNNTLEACNTGSQACTTDEAWPTVSYSWPGNMPDTFGQNSRHDKIFKVTDARGQTTEYVHNTFDAHEDQPGLNPLPHTRLTAIRYPSGEEKIYTYGNKIVNGSGPYGYLTKIEMGEASWDYNHYTPSGAPTNVQYFFGGSDTHSDRKTMQHISTGYQSIKQVITSTRLSDNIPITYKVINADHVEAYFWPAYGNLLDHVIFPEGNKTQYIYDDNNSLIEIQHIPRPGSSEPTITQTQTFPSGACTNRKTCYQPMAITDGRGHTTQYTYHAESGQIATVTQPADNKNVRPQTRYRYEQKYAWYKNENGTLEKADTPIWLLTETSTCMTGAPTNDNDVNSGCAIVNDEVITQYDYGPDNQANNLWLRGVKVIHGGESRLTCYEYNKLGIQTRVIPPKGNVGKHSCE